MIEKRSGEIVSLQKWDERRLAYEINDKTRGTYILVYFNAEPDQITKLERDINLSEDVMRALILRADFVDQSQPIDKETPIEAAERLEREVVAKAEIESNLTNEESDDSDSEEESD